jgi:hypothetical protein
MAENKAEATFADKKSVKGKWSTIYDQAIKVELENG